MLGRQAGYFLIVACQRPDAKYFSDGIRDNFNFRVGLGRISELGYGMLFGSDVKKQFFQKRIENVYRMVKGIKRKKGLSSGEWHLNNLRKIKRKQLLSYYRWQQVYLYFISPQLFDN